MNTCHNLDIIVQTIGRDASSLNGKGEIPNKTLANITRDLLMKSSHKKELFVLPISTPSVSPAEPRIFCVVMLLTSSGMEQYLHTNA